jgi:hypothetical protein
VFFLMNPTLIPQTVQRARTFLRHRTEAVGGLFDLSRVRGRVVEVSEAGFFGALSVLVGLMDQVQSQGEQIAWVETGPSLFFPPDLAFRGLDVGAISVVLAPTSAGGLQAADWLLRSGAFGLVVVDWAGGAIGDSELGRLGRLTEDRDSTALFLTKKRPEDPSLATQVSLRGTVGLTPGGETEWGIIKDKRSGPPSRQRMRYHGPFGLY